MIIAVLLKQVDFVRSRTGADPEKGFVSPNDRVTLNNPLDEAGLEQALRIKNAEAGDEVWVLCMGERLHHSEAYRALALGADHFVFLGDAAWQNTDAWATAGILSRTVQKLNAGLVLCGTKSLDRGAGEVGAFTAHRLGVPYVGDVIACRPRDGQPLLLLERALRQGAREQLEARLPLVIGVGPGATQPGYPSYGARSAAASKNIIHWGATDLHTTGDAHEIGVPRVGLGPLRPPKPRPRRTAVPDAGMNAYARIDWLLAGTESAKSGAVIEGEPLEMARKLMEFLLEKKLVNQGRG